MATIDVENSGKQIHMASFAKLKPGKTVADARAAIKSAKPGTDNPLADLTEKDTPLDDVGKTTIAVTNTSGATREIILAKLKKGKTPEDVDAYFKKAGDNLPDPVASPLEYFAYVFDAKQTRYLTADLTPGQWALGAQPPDHPETPLAKDPSAVLFTVE